MTGITTTELVSITGATGSITADVPNPERYHRHRFWVEIGTAANIEIQASYNGSVWMEIKTITTDGEIKVLPEPFSHMRVNVTGNTGTTKVNLQQYNTTMGAF